MLDAGQTDADHCKPTAGCHELPIKPHENHNLHAIGLPWVETKTLIIVECLPKDSLQMLDAGQSIAEQQLGVMSFPLPYMKILIFIQIGYLELKP